MMEAANENGSFSPIHYGVIMGLIKKSSEMKSLQEVLECVIEELANLPWLDLQPRGAILLLNSKGQLVMVGNHGFSETRAALCAHVDLDRCACGQVARNAEGGVFPCQFDYNGDGSESGKVSHHFILPLTALGGVIGTLPFCLRHEQRMTAAELEFFRDLESLISGSIQQLLTKEMVEIRELELEDAQSEIINKLGVAAEYRDNETGMHVIRMKEYAGAIAKVMGLTPRDRERLVTTAPMHDVGKIGIQDDILLKPGKLTAEQFNSMKTHAQIGATILAGDDLLMRDSRNIALNHHEKFDGSGYPKGKKGEEIPLFGRICAVADVFDALTSERPYKKAWSVAKSLDLIKNSSGSHFDPKVVDAFLQALPEVLRTKQLYRDDVIDPHEQLELPPAQVSEDAWFSWDDSLSVGIDVIDEHHRYLIDLTNDLHTSVTEGHGCKAVGRTLRALERYTHVHFGEEERLMRYYGYADFPEQLTQHHTFCEKIADFWDDFKISPLTLGYEATHFLKEWLIHHVTEKDSKLRNLHLLAAVPHMMALVIKWDSRFDDSKIAMMTEIYNRHTGSDLDEEKMRHAIKAAKKGPKSEVEYLKEISVNLTDEQRTVLIKAAQEVVAADGTCSISEDDCISTLADALGIVGTEA